MILRLCGALLAFLPLQAVSNEALLPVPAPWLPAFDFSLTQFHWVSFTAPRWRANAYARIRIPGPDSPSAVWMNSAPLPPVPGVAGEWELSPLPAFGSRLLLGVVSAIQPSGVVLVMSPRVYLSRIDLTPCSGSLSAIVWVRNTLDNTVNVALMAEIRPGREPILAAPAQATIPPGLIQPLALKAAHAALRPPSEWDLLLRLEKAEEAVEAAYTVTENVTFFVPPPGSTACR